jgi:hypothetical protein
MLKTPPQIAGSSNHLPARTRAPVRPLALAVTGAGTIALFAFGPGILSVLAILAGLLVFVGATLVKKSLEATSLPAEVDRMKELKRHILKSRYLENVGDLGDRVADQMELAAGRFEKLRALLGLKFDLTELTYGRYLGVAEAAFLSVVDNLHTAAISLAALDVKDNSADPERLALRQQQLTKVRQLLTLNERAITELERVTAALGEVKTRRGEGSQSLDAVMEQLTELANRAKLYSVETLDTGKESGEKK